MLIVVNKNVFELRKSTANQTEMGECYANAVIFGDRAEQFDLLKIKYDRLVQIFIFLYF